MYLLWFNFLGVWWDGNEYLTQENKNLTDLKNFNLKYLNHNILLTIKLILSPQNLPQQNVFAYLPLRSYGFRFIIQGDFEVPSSREDVDSDKSWNQWLREEIPQLFIDALSVFMVCCYIISCLFLKICFSDLFLPRWRCFFWPSQLYLQSNKHFVVHFSSRVN